MQTPMSSRSSRVRKPVQHFGSLVSSDILSEGEEGGKADVPEEDSEDDFEMKDRDESDDERVEIQDESEEEAVPAGEDSEDELILVCSSLTSHSYHCRTSDCVIGFSQSMKDSKIDGF